MDAAVDQLRGLRVNSAEKIALKAGSERAVLYAVEQARAPGVKSRGAMAAKLIRDGERPPASWRTQAERDAAQPHPALMGDRAPHAAKAQRERERNQAKDEAEKALIARHPAIADLAVATLTDGDGLDARTLRGKTTTERRTHRLTREAVLAAIEDQTGERAHPEPSNHTERPTRARELAR